jgi:hypothetical protein
MPLRLADYPAVAILCIVTSSTSLGMDCLSASYLIVHLLYFGCQTKVGFHPYKKRGFRSTSQ